jgi:DNA-binding NarL/FixJ family response regulator
MDSADGSSPPDGELLCAIRPLSSSRFTCLALHRPAARGGFTDRDLAFVELVHDTCPLVASPKLAAKNAPNLPRRCIEVLHLLCDGHSEKEISTNLEIGMGTVHTYVKTLYRHFDVKTRSELLSLWIRKKRADRKYVSKLAFGRSTLSSRIRGDSPV